MKPDAFEVYSLNLHPVKKSSYTVLAEIVTVSIILTCIVFLFYVQ